MKTEEALAVAKRALRAHSEIHLLAEALSDAGCFRAAERVRDVAGILIDAIEFDDAEPESAEG